MITVASRQYPQTVKDLRPIPLWQTLLFFGIPGILIYLGTYYVVPELVDAGMPLIWAWTLTLFIPYQPLAIGLVVHYLRQPGHTWRSFQERFRLTAMPRKAWLWILLGFPMILVLNFSLEWTMPLLTPFFPPAPVIPELFANPYAAVQAGGAIGTFFGEPMAGNYWLLGFWLLWALIAVIGEEIIWRGYLMPRMELSYGRWAWLINGLLWNALFHLYTLYNLFTDMPFMLILPFLAQRTQSTWLAIILHIMMLLLAFAILIPGVLA